MIPADEALEKLKEGNRRFLAAVENCRGASLSYENFANLATGQNPFAIILGCSDSRVPSELVFDQGLGDLFVVRVAGNIAAPTQIGSIEFAAQHFGTRLIVVLGHTRCGAVQATVDALQNPTGRGSENLSSIVDRIRPAVEPLVSNEIADDPEDPAALMKEAVRANIRASAEQLRRGSPELERLLANDGLQIVSAEYSLETGEVVFL